MLAIEVVMGDPELTPEEYLERLRAILDRNTLPLSYTLDGWAIKWAIDTIATLQKKSNPAPPPSCTIPDIECGEP
jgi:hypothetical protein